MTQYLISFGGHAMGHIPGEDAPAVARAAHAAVQEAINAGVYVSAGGLANQPASVVAAAGSVTGGPVPGGYRRVHAHRGALTRGGAAAGGQDRRRLPLRARGPGDRGRPRTRRDARTPPRHATPLAGHSGLPPRRCPAVPARTAPTWARSTATGSCGCAAHAPSHLRHDHARRWRRLARRAGRRPSTVLMGNQIAESAGLAVRSACIARPAQMTWFCTLKPEAADDLTAA